MEYGTDLLFFEMTDQPGACIEVRQQDVIHVGIMAAGFRSVNRSAQEALLFEWFEQGVVMLPGGHAFFSNFAGFFELGIEECSDDFTGQVA